MKASEVTAVIPHWNRRAHLARALESLSSQTEPPARVLVVDNGSTDGSDEVAAGRGAEWIALDRNYGFARAVNEGLARVRTKYAAVLNNDVILQPAYLERLRAAMEAHEADLAAGQLLQPETGLQDGSFDLICRGATAWRAGHGRPAETAREAQIVPFLPMTATLFRTSLFSELGLLDEEFQSYLEDVDFGLRCARAHKVALYVPMAIAGHSGSATFGTWSPSQVFLLARNQVLLVAKHMPSGWLRHWGWAVMAAQGLWGLLAIRHCCGLAWLRGKWAGLRLYAATRRRANPYPPAELEELACANETRMRVLGAQNDVYWRWYFRLVR